MYKHLRLLLTTILTSMILIAPVTGTASVSYAEASKCDLSAIVATVGKNNLKTPRNFDGNILLLQERHDIIAGQLEGAVMIHRLLRDCGYRAIGLEGTFPNTSFMTPWRDSKNISSIILANAAVGLLGKGEINQTEFAALVYPNIYTDFQINGVDDEALYHTDIPFGSGDIETGLLMVGFTQLSDNNFQTVATMLNNAPEDKTSKAYQQWRDKLVKFVFTNSTNTDIKDWYKRKTATLAPCMVESIETEKMLNDKALSIVQELQVSTEKTLDVSLDDDIATGKAVSVFYDTAYKRSVAMVQQLKGILKAGTPDKIVVVIGAAHTEWMNQQLTADGFKTAILSPLSLCNNDISTELSDVAFENKQNQKSVDAKGFLGALLSGGSKKPEIVMNEPWFQVEDSLVTMALMVNEAILANPTAPVDLKQIFQGATFAPGVSVDTSSLTAVSKTKSGKRGYMFRANINVPGVPPTEIFIGIDPTRNKQQGDTISLTDTLDIEKLLLAELKAVKAGDTKPSSQVAIASGVRAAFGTAKPAVEEALQKG